MMKPLCIFHGKCADGFTAAWAVHRALGDEVEFHPGVHQDAPPDVTKRHVILVDFSYKRPVLDEMFRVSESLLVLDHHKTAAEDLAGYRAPFGPGWKRYLHDVYQDACENAPQPYATFDMERSGAQIAWDFFVPDEPRPQLVDFVGDRDLWRFKLPMSREVNAFIFAHDYTFENWDYLNNMLADDAGARDVCARGQAIEKKHHKDVAELVSVMKRRMVIGGHDVPVANIPYTMTSDAGHLMAQGEPFAACYWDTPEGRVFSLRSTTDGLDVSAVAATYGGGGHARASGFRMPIGWEGQAA
jgi:oligoribonuclease NrnB/cAMP/cGMP phosphodiesterase (DHH superfamily)